MKERLTPPDWNAYDHNMLINVGDIKYYYENFTDIVDQVATSNHLSIQTLDGRVAALEHSIPVGPGGDGAYLHLGGTPERYPTALEMTEGDGKETSFLVVARTDGIYFYNPKTKLLIPPKKGGGTIAVHGQFPQIFDAGHSIQHNGRLGLSGVYTAKASDIGLGSSFTTYENCKVLIVVNENGEEYQTAFSPDGTASRIFSAGNQTATWELFSGSSGGSGSGVDPSVLQEIRDRISVLENKPVPKFTELADTPSGYHPGKLVGYNLTGDAMVPVDVLDSFSKLADTPASYSGNARKFLAVNPSEDGIDYIEGPDLSNLQSEVSNLFNEVINLQNTDAVQDTTIEEIDTRVQALENATPPASGASVFTELLDTPDTLQPKKYLVVNDAGTALVHSTLTTDDTLGLAALGEGMTNGNVLLHQNCLGGPTILSGLQVIPSSMVEESAMILVGAWQDSTVVNLPGITSHLTSPIPSGFVRAGRITSIYNRTSNSKSITIRPDPAKISTVKMKSKTYTNISSFVVAPGRVAKFVPLIDAGVQYWALIEDYSF